ncbi:MAG TPA: TetR/AcrR family transcriptional regulator [Tepidisphaeraceae bacterium]|nr:TetR/AcrR family transcriptional regulator [Tepidisphaeraceae bacterium]
MQRPDEKKREKILATAAKLFATRPFHQVRLDDVAAEAQVGKGTLYIYFKGKEDLYCSLIHDGFVRLNEQFKQQISQETPPLEALKRVVRHVVAFSMAYPHFYELMRAMGITLKDHKGLCQQRQAMIGAIESIICRGVRQGIWFDPHPELTANFIPGMVRAAVLYGPKSIDEDALVEQILRLLCQGLQKEESR